MKIDTAIGKDIYIFGDTDEATLDQARNVAQHAEHVALMADNHLGYWMPVGGVAAFKDKVSVTGVGVDIACGNCAIQTDIKLSSFSKERLQEIADEIFNSLSFGMGRKNLSDDAPVNDPLFEDNRWHIVPEQFREKLRSKAREQLGTIGGGNHYVDVFSDDNGFLWVGVHFGSRGFGHTVAQAFMSISRGQPWGTISKESEVGGALLDVYQPSGAEYVGLMKLAGEYAYAGREWVARKVVGILGGKETYLVHNHHNFAWKEIHGGREFWVVRKGATPAFPGQSGFVGGSAGDNAVILRGIGTDDLASRFDRIETAQEQRAALFSTVHGAGRVMSRGKATGKNRRGKQVREAMIRTDDWQRWLSDFGVIMKGGDVDEAPQAYRRLPDVLAAQGTTVEVIRNLRPVIACMAPSDIHDPFKD